MWHSMPRADSACCHYNNKWIGTMPCICSPSLWAIATTSTRSATNFKVFGNFLVVSITKYELLISGVIDVAFYYMLSLSNFVFFNVVLLIKLQFINSPWPFRYIALITEILPHIHIMGLTHTRARSIFRNLNVLFDKVKPASEDQVLRCAWYWARRSFWQSKHLFPLQFDLLPVYFELIK